MYQLKFKSRRVFNSGCIIAVCILVMIGYSANAQTSDSLKKSAKEYKNSIKLNLSSRVIYKNSYQFIYERVIKKYQTLNIFAGYQEFPLDLSLNLDSSELKSSRKNSGYSFGADYRFYLSKENKFNAPRGVYLGPFISFFHFTSERILSHTDDAGVESSGNLNTEINFVSIGGQFGYQFVLGERWVIDAILFGPSVTSYNFNAKLDNNFPGIDKNEALQAVIDALKEKLPLLNDLSSEKGVSGSGTQAFWAVGFRYNISVGFRF